MTDDATRAALDVWFVASWPQLDARLQERRLPFFDAAHERAARRGLDGWEPRARYVNLCCALGPGFEERPENEWALALLSDRRLADGVRMHQLVRRAIQELARRGGDGAALQRADAALLDVLDAGRRAADPDAEPMPRVACDFEALELRVLDASWREEYRTERGAWQRVGGIDPPAPLRIDAQHPAPSVAHVLTHAGGDGVLAQLQLRQRTQGGCGERHPAVRWLDARGVSAWHGHGAKAASWDVAALAQPAPPGGLGVVLVEQTAPAVHVLQALTCGVRDEGVPLGPVALQVWAWPAHQWLAAWHREPSPARTWPAAAGAPAAAPATAPPTATRLKLERDGTPLDVTAWLGGFDDLATAIDTGLGRLFEAWNAAAAGASMRAAPHLLGGRSALTWGWRDGPQGLASAPVMRVLADLDITCGIELALEGEITTGASRSRLRLTAAGAAPLQASVVHERPTPPVPSLLEALLPARCRFRFPFQAEFDPIATRDGVVWCDAGPCTGAVVGEAGLRPRGLGSGWQWFVQAAVEPVALPVTLHDPVLGRTRRTLQLLPATPLVDWSLG
jgi:hypothetical protein